MAATGTGTQVEAPPADPPEAPGPTDPGVRWPAVAVAVALGLPLIAGLVATVAHGVPLVQDYAVMDLRGRDLLTRHVPLVGPYSRFGWNHPGPWSLWALGGAALVTGAAPWAAVAGQVAVQAGAVALTVGTARRRPGALVVAGAAVVMSLVSVGPYAVLRVWNPHAALPFFAVFVLQCWLLADGERRVLPWALAVGSFCVQTHVGYAPLVAAGLAWALVRGRPAPDRRLAFASGAVLAVAWAPVALDTVTAWPGNLAAIARYFLTSGAPAVGPRTGAGLVADAFRWPPPWAGGAWSPASLLNTAVPASPAWLLVPVAALAAAWALRADRTVTRLVELLAVLLAAGLVASTRLHAPAEAHMLQWRATVAVWIAGALALALLGRLPGERRRVPLAALTAVAVVVPSVLYAAAVVDRGRAGDPYANALAVLLPGLAEQAPAEPFEVAVAGSDYGGIQQGVVNELDRRGRPARVETAQGFKYGPGRALAPGERTPVVWHVFEEGRFVVTGAAQPGARLLTYTTPLDAADEAELQGLQRRLAAATTAAGRPEAVDKLDTAFAGLVLDGVPGVARADAERLAALNERVVASGRCRCGVWADGGS